MLNLSVIIITKDAAGDIRQCLESVKWADEIIVLDSGSSDRTREICSEYTPQVFSVDWPGFGIQKNRTLAKARGKWVLSLDADEFLSNGLCDEIRQIIASEGIDRDAYIIKRVSFFCEKRIKWGDWGRDWVIRLFRNRSDLQFSPVLVHEVLVGYQHLGRLGGVIFHQAITQIDQILLKAAAYSTLGAHLALQHHKRASFPKAVLRSLWCFIRGYIIRLGFLDAKEGFIIAYSNAVGVFYRYVKLMYYNQTSSHADRVV